MSIPWSFRKTVTKPTVLMVAMKAKASATPPNWASTPDADAWVANWGAWLASLGYLPAARWVSVTTSTAPDPGATLASQVAATASPTAPRQAQEIMSQLVATAPAAAADVQTWVSLTLDPAAFPGAPATIEAAVAETSQVIAGLESALAGCGVTVLGRARAADIAGAVRIAFDPALRGQVSQLLAAGIGPALEDELNWASAGPLAERRSAGTATSTTAATQCPGPGGKRPARTSAATCSPGSSRPAPIPSGSPCSTGRCPPQLRLARWTARSAPPSSAASTPAASAAT